MTVLLKQLLISWSKTSSYNISWEEDFNSVINIPRRYFLRNMKTRLRKSFKSILNRCKFRIVFKSQRKLANVFWFKDRLPFDLVTGAVYEYTFGGRCNSRHYGVTSRHLKVRSREHIRLSPLTFRKVKPSKESAIRDRLLICNNITSFDGFTT